MAFDLISALRMLVDGRGSDLHVKAGNRPLIRVDGRLRPLDPAAPVLAPQDTENVLHDILPDSRIAMFEARNEADFAYSAHGIGRFRVNAFVQRGAITLIFRAVPSAMRSVEDLGLPPAVGVLAGEERGMILVAGSTGSGKSTTLAAIVEQINRTVAKHIVTIEDPIEFLHADDQSEINQREVGSDTESFDIALRRVLRQDPDVIMIGEMRDAETAHTALSAAETGHLVLSTLHTVDACETINRVIDFFPLHQHEQVRTMLAGALKGIVCQRLVPAASGRGRVAICEVLTMTGRIADMIVHPEQTAHLRQAISEGGFYGMQTFDQALHAAIVDGRITLEEGMRNASYPQDLKLLLAFEGHMKTSMADVPTLHG